MTEFAAEYGDALYSLARSEGIEERILEEAEALNECFAAEPAYLTLIGNPALPREEREGLIDAALRERVHPYLMSFVKLLAVRGGAGEFSACVKRFRENEYRDHGIAVAQAVTARPLTDEQRAALAYILSRDLNVAATDAYIERLLEARTDASLLGGVRVNVEGRTYDNTLRNRIDEIGQALRTDA